MAKMIAISVFIAAALWSARALHAAEEYYVQSVKAKVMSGATFKSAVLGEVDRGYLLVSTGKEDGWIKVKYNDRDGYVHSFVLRTYPPIENVSAITGNEQELRRGFRRRASSSIGAESGRGLDVGGGDSGVHADYESLEKIELFTMSYSEVKRFMEGKE